ncbi:MAG TPA: TMEM165/GDT1 family protein, partial [Thermoanaerobacterales bacterium]|nr:TMEM165/GDT1 family protein [Thermoanaerobacterales bacterium]
MLSTFLVTFGTILLAELGDKTQLAIMLTAAHRTEHSLWVFLGASSALIVTTLIGVFLGGYIGKVIPAQYKSYTCSC